MSLDYLSLPEFRWDVAIKPRRFPTGGQNADF